MQAGRGGMGSRKHGKSGTPGPNRRALQSLAREVNRASQKPPRRQRWFRDVKKLMEEEKP